MGCGASAATETAPESQTPAKFDGGKTEVAPAEGSAKNAKEEKRDEILSRYKLSEKDKGRIIAYPVFKIPTKYIAPEHKIECAFYATKDETCTDVTLFFFDKGHEGEIVERQGVTFSLNKSDDKTAYTKVSFDHTWAGSDTWETLPNDESHSHSEPYESFEQEEHPSPVSSDQNTNVSRPVLYINTATHLLSNKDTNNCTEHTTIASYPIFAGNARQATEILFRVSEATNPDKKEVSALAALIPVRTSHAPNKKPGDKEKKKPKPAEEAKT
eukprot:TRINITY_DN2806_c0_g1_i1.p1 TRINITY_DN2806_c0_g1~~TRINITY_DN2806_c0_g1_i1.p1  ORF type:complete len:271 (-),score=13.50 TRINITY_DN2806_c0_g1_i1:131-943(-)